MAGSNYTTEGEEESRFGSVWALRPGCKLGVLGLGV